MKSIVTFMNEAMKNKSTVAVNDYANINDKRLNPKWLDDGSNNEKLYWFLPNTPAIKKAAVSPVAVGKYWIAFDNQDAEDATLSKIGFNPEDWGGYDEASWDPDYNEMIDVLKEGGAKC